MAIAILGWPIDKLPPEVAQQVIEGGRSVCREVGISLAGGHSIDSPEPIFGLAVTGMIETEKVKRNSQAESGCHLYLTKPLGIGVLTTAEKKSKLEEAHKGLARDWMCKVNSIGAEFAELPCVKAMTDVTGFGLLGHLTEICEGSNLSARIWFDKVPTLPGVYNYVELGCVPGGTHRNFSSYGHKIAPITETQKAILCDPQTSGGLLIAVSPNEADQAIEVAKQHGIELEAVGELLPPQSDYVIEVI